MSTTLFKSLDLPGVRTASPDLAPANDLRRADDLVDSSQHYVLEAAASSWLILSADATSTTPDSEAFPTPTADVSWGNFIFSLRTGRHSVRGAALQYQRHFNVYRYLLSTTA